jgi:hypothetical protein
VTTSANVSLEEIRAVLIDYLSDVLDVAPTELSTDRPLQDYGADSVVALAFGSNERSPQRARGPAPGDASRGAAGESGSGGTDGCSLYDIEGCEDRVTRRHRGRGESKRRRTTCAVLGENATRSTVLTPRRPRPPTLDLPKPSV